jgi:hypothetical protein
MNRPMIGVALIAITNNDVVSDGRRSLWQLARPGKYQRL